MSTRPTTFREAFADHRSAFVRWGRLLARHGEDHPETKAAWVHVELAGTRVLEFESGATVGEAVGS